MTQISTKRCLTPFDYSNCALAQEVLSNVRDHLEVQELDGTMTCMDPEMAYDFELSVLKEI